MYHALLEGISAKVMEVFDLKKLQCSWKGAPHLEIPCDLTAAYNQKQIAETGKVPAVSN